MAAKVSFNPSEDNYEFVKEKNEESIKKGKYKAKKVSICIIITIIILVVIL